MKKFIAGLLCGAVLMLSTSVLADGVLEQISAYLDKGVNIEVGEKKVELKNAPINYEGSIYLPVRELAGIVGLSVDWDDNTRTAKLGNDNNVINGSPETPSPVQSNNTNESSNIAPIPVVVDGLPQFKVNEHLFIGLTAWQLKTSAEVTADYQNRKIVIKRAGKDDLIINASDTDEFMIVNDMSFINSSLVE